MQNLCDYKSLKNCTYFSQNGLFLFLLNWLSLFFFLLLLQDNHRLHLNLLNFKNMQVRSVFQWWKRILDPLVAVDLENGVHQRYLILLGFQCKSLHVQVWGVRLFQTDFEKNSRQPLFFESWENVISSNFLVRRCKDETSHADNKLLFFR
jgi:hypothetical protein